MDIITLSHLFSNPGIVSIDKALGNNFVQMMLQAGLVVKCVLIILILFSVVSWSIILIKWRLFRRARQETAFFLDLFWENTGMSKLYDECEDLLYSPIAHLFRTGFFELRRIKKFQDLPKNGNWDSGFRTILDGVERSLKKTATDQSNRFEKALSFLATTGNTAPFIGLFGTVWGIMEAFTEIGLKGSASLAVVAPGISEALIATAVGLFAAIPAVVAYNYFNSRVAVVISEMENFASDYLTLIERQVLRMNLEQKQD